MAVTDDEVKEILEEENKETVKEARPPLCENCEDEEVEHKGDWCDRCNGLEKEFK